MTNISSESYDTHAMSEQAEDLLARWPYEALLAGNLRALETFDGELAKRIGYAEVGSTYRPAVAKDGSVSFQNHREDGTTPWLGKSSIPVVFAESNQKRIDVGQGNLVMQGIGHGADTLAILERMGPSQALFVVESDAASVKLVFQIRDFSRYLKNRQLVILLGDSIEQAAGDFYASHPGYPIVQKAAVLPCWSDKENQVFAQQVNAAMEQCVVQLAGQVSDLMEQQTQWDQARHVDEVIASIKEGQFNRLRVTQCSNRYNEQAVTQLRGMMSGLGALGAASDHFQYDRADRVSSYAQLERLLALKANLIFLVDSLRGDVNPALPQSAVCVTLMQSPERLADEGARPAEQMGEHDFVFAPTAEQLDSLKEAGYDEKKIGLLPPAADTNVYQPVTLSDDEQSRYGGDVVLAAGRADSDAETYGINLPTHQRLWQAVAEEICDSAEKYHADIAERYLKRAQRCGVEVKEQALFEHFGQLVANVLGDVVLRDFYATFLLKREVVVRIWGRRPLHPSLRDEQPNFWEQSAAAEAVAGEIGEGEELNRLFNAAKIHLHINSRGGVDAHLLNGIAAGAFFLVKSHPSDKQPGGLSEFFKIGREIITFDNPNDLVRKVKQYLRDDEGRKQIAEAGQKRCRETHSYHVRMREMLEIMGKRFTG